MNEVTVWCGAWSSHVVRMGMKRFMTVDCVHSAAVTVCRDSHTRNDCQQRSLFRCYSTRCAKHWNCCCTLYNGFMNEHGKVLFQQMNILNWCRMLWILLSSYLQPCMKMQDWSFNCGRQMNVTVTAIALMWTQSVDRGKRVIQQAVDNKK